MCPTAASKEAAWLHMVGAKLAQLLELACLRASLQALIQLATTDVQLTGVSMHRLSCWERSGDGGPCRGRTTLQRERYYRPACHSMSLTSSATCIWMMLSSGRAGLRCCLLWQAPSRGSGSLGAVSCTILWGRIASLCSSVQCQVSESLIGLPDAMSCHVYNRQSLDRIAVTYWTAFIHEC